MKFLGIGYCCTDILFNITGEIVENRKIEAASTGIQGGGPVGTATAALARWGVRASFAGSIGDDAPGRFILEDFRSIGVDTTMMKVTPGARSAVSAAVSHGRGKRTVFFAPGDAPPMKARDASTRGCGRFNAIEVDGHQIEAQLEAVRSCRSSGVPVVLDAGSLREELVPLLELSDHIVASKDFADAYEPGGNYERTCRRLLDLGAKAAVVTLGDRGSVGLDAGGAVVQPAYEVKVVDTVGAGDIYHAGYIYGLLDGRDLSGRMKLASVAAGMKCRGLGGRDPVPSIEEVLAACRSK